MSLITKYLEHTPDRCAHWKERARLCRTEQDWESHYFHLHMEAWAWANNDAALAASLERAIEQSGANNPVSGVPRWDPESERWTLVSLQGPGSLASPVMIDAQTAIRLLYALKGRLYAKNRGFKKRITQHADGSYVRANPTCRKGGPQFRTA